MPSKYIPPHRRDNYVVPPAGFDTLDISTSQTTTRIGYTAQTTLRQSNSNDNSRSREANYRIKGSRDVQSLQAACSRYIEELNFPINICAALTQLAKLCESDLPNQRQSIEYSLLTQQLLIKAQQKILLFHQGELCVLAWTLGRLSINSKALFDDIAKSVQPQLSRLSDKELCMLANGFALAEQRDYVLFHGILNELNGRELSKFRPDALATLCSAYGKVNFSEQSNELRRLAEEVDIASESMTGQELCMVTSGFSVFRDYPQLIEKIAQEICLRAPPTITSKGIASIILGICSVEYAGGGITDFLLREIKYRPPGDIYVEVLGRLAQLLATHEVLTKERFDLLLNKITHFELSQLALRQWHQAGMELHLKGYEVQWPERLEAMLVRAICPQLNRPV